MSISILISKICALFIMVFAGVMLVRTGVCKSEDSRVLSAVCVYLVAPCSIISAFQVSYTSDVIEGLALAYLAAVLLALLTIVLVEILAPKLHLNGVEKASVIYSNAGNLVIPLVSSVLGEEWVIYSIAYMTLNLVLIWSHGKMSICGERKPDIKKIITSVNMIAVMVGFTLFIAKIELPGSVNSAVSSMGAMIGPMSMLVTGMLNANADIKKILAYPKIWLVTAMRLVVIPAMCLVVLKFSPLAGLVPNGRQVLLITLIGMITPSASNVVQIAQVYNKDADYAGAINVVTTLMCIVTMPVMIYLYQM